MSREKQSELKKKGYEKVLKLSKKLQKHTERNLNIKHTNYKIQYILHDPFTFVNAYTKISKNKGALTKGYNDDNIMEYFGLEQATNLAKQIKNGTYKFKPVKRTWIPKPEKNKKRPVDVPTQSDRIVQEAIRGLLEAIYEPVFKSLGERTKDLCNNYGFRPKCSTWIAIDKLNRYSKKCTVVIKGDVISAYNNVDHDILLNVLKKRIKDKAFINLIKDILKSGIMDDKKFEHSLNGTPQGGIVSPLLFNIYLLDFDEYVYDKFILPILEENKNKKKRIISKEYKKVKYHCDKALREFRAAKKKQLRDKKEIKILRKKFKKLEAIRNQTPQSKFHSTTKNAVFVRYADDWVLTITSTIAEAQQIKKQISEYLLTHKKLHLDEEKTKITTTSDGYKFLGFEIRIRTKKPRLKRVLIKDIHGKYSRPLKRTTSRQLTIEPDKIRILKRLRLLKFCNTNNEPRGKASWLVYNDFQIVQKYNKIFRGIFNYYAPCERYNRLYQISYILQYSCAKTLARKKKISMKKIFMKYGRKLGISITTKSIKDERVRYTEFNNLTQLIYRRKNQIHKPITPIDSDPFRIQEHWRTKFKLYNECCMCGETEGIALHHINSLGSIKTKKRDDFEYIRSQTNRVQIPVCTNCHNDITYGRYNNPKKPIEFFNEFLAKL